MTHFPHLFSPFRLGNLTLKNRLVMSPMAVNYSTEKGEVEQRQIEYYAERARGGVGLIISESNYISPDGRTERRRLGLYLDEMVPQHRRLVDAIHRENTPILAQLLHAGRNARPGIIGQYPVGPSAVPLLTKGQLYVGVIPRVLTVTEIEQLVELYAKATRRALAAGFDGILVHASNGYLLHTFLSPRSNKRTDAYGGSEENRSRFLLEVVRRIRGVMGPEKPLVVRVTAEEHQEGGYDIGFICRLARWLEEAGIDEINVSAGTHEETEWCIPPRTFAEGFNVGNAARVKSAVKIAVSTVGRIKRPAMAEQILAEGKADLIWMGRALIADPNLPRKAQAGEVDHIRECISCGLCADGIGHGEPMRCTTNPDAGREVELRLEPAAKPRRVLVIGGGPAGLEAARRAAARGHRVRLFEQRAALGGQLRYAAAAPHAIEMGRLADYLAREAVAAGVEVLTEARATPARVAEAEPEVVVVASGAVPLVPSIPGVGMPHVFTAHQVLEGEVDDRLGRRVAVIGGGLTGVTAAEYLLKRDREVVIVEMQDWIMTDGTVVEQRTLTQELSERGVLILVQTKVEAITSRGLVVTRGGEREVLAADCVVLAAGVRAEREILAHLDVDCVEVHVVGDAEQPRRLMQALLAGATVGGRI
jgi:2,4-dienoyl-CoA reductase-like NADH-dependent reductase (Old Yellow Enzyme family)/NADPH-dependent 2,4-dienoyl-CoA reductase/sulfur reductase-like enzyme